MAKIDILNLEGAVSDQMELADSIFGIEPNEAVVHQVVKAQLANKRQGTAKTKTRSEVRGGGRKPYRQKGTGRARHGSIRSAQYVGGGIIFGPVPRSYRQLVPKKIRRLALKSVLSDKMQNNDLVVVENFDLAEIKTKNFVAVLKKLGLADQKVLIVADKFNQELQLSARNVPNVLTSRVESMNTLDVLRHNKFVMTKAAAEKVQEVYV